MKPLTLSEVDRQLKEGTMGREALERLIEEDGREGLKKRREGLRREEEKRRREEEEFRQRNVAEEELWREGFFQIAGCDEVGRGPLAGPVVACAVILDPHKPIYGLKDSKKLSASRREELARQIMEDSVDYALCEVSAERIDAINILEATREAMTQAIRKLRHKPDFLLIDALHLPELDLPQRGIIGGDDQVHCISAASILAKVFRDHRMQEMAALYPEYGFDRHKGYGSAYHMEQLKRWGPCPLHRRSFIQSILSGTRWQEHSE